MRASISRRISALVVPAGMLAMMAFSGLLAFILYEERQDALRNAKHNALNLATIVERDITRNFELFSLSLEGAVESFHSMQWRARPADTAYDESLFDKALTARHISSALILDKNGLVIANSSRSDLATQSFQDREYFQHQMHAARDELFVSVPFVSRISNRPSIGLSRRLTTDGEIFSGVAVLILDLSYFQELLSGLDLGSHGASAIVGDGGIILTRQPRQPRQPITSGLNSAPHADFFRRLVNQETDGFVAKSGIDGVERLFVSKKIDNTNLQVVIAPAISNIYQAWEKRAWIIGSMMVILCGGFLCLSYALRLQLMARQAAEENLRHLATSDALTGLRNRRALDRVLKEEWLRLKRGTEGLCLIFADIDYFKKFNDLRGHIAGDEALAAVAGVLSQTARRFNDEVARYGGEEFIVVLPQTSIEGAIKVAETIRAAVESLAIPHPNSSFNVVTVSIGVAGTMLEEFPDTTALLTAADTALYQAKDKGRNRVEVYSGLPRDSLQNPAHKLLAI